MGEIWIFFYTVKIFYKTKFREYFEKNLQNTEAYQTRLRQTRVYEMAALLHKKTGVGFFKYTHSTSVYWVLSWMVHVDVYSDRLHKACLMKSMLWNEYWRTRTIHWAAVCDQISSCVGQIAHPDIERGAGDVWRPRCIKSNDIPMVWSFCGRAKQCEIERRTWHSQSGDKTRQWRYMSKKMPYRFRKNRLSR